MKLTYDKKSPKPTSYTMSLSAIETLNWAHKPMNSWPCSELADHQIMVLVDSNGLADFTLDGKSAQDVNADELAAIIADHLPAALRHLWPTWENKA
jgi:hypothetical protein